jgi:serine/threonine protein kinase
MNPHTPVTSESSENLAHILDDYLAALQEGRAVGEDELLARHPEHANELRECLASLEFIRRAHVRPPQVERETAAVAVPAVGTLGDFRLIREVGRGGMGVVYEAEQLSLGRLVALKVLPFAATLDPKQLQRFKNEAQAAAHLHHTNIVPVHAVGCERGVHYYAMQYIAGRTLAAMIHDLRRQAGKELPAPQPVSDPTGPAPTPSTRRPTAAATTERSDPGFFRTVARLGVQAAEALEHAHQVGILHRDIKPGNLLVDVAGHLWVTDFGLAQMPTDVNLTLTGDLVGTLRYMSPEQARARPGLLDHRTDVYSLGVTLYELATLEPAFSGRDRQELLRQITTEEPRAPRRVNPAVPVELETIILKAMDKAPADRYPTARELAEDLDRFLRDEPIRGRRPTVIHQLRKWTRRNWGVVCTGLVAAAVLLVTLAIGSTVAAFRLNEAWKAADDKADELSRHVAQKEDELARLNEASCLIQNSRSSIDKFMLREAHDDLNRAVALRPDLTLTWFARGDFLMRMGLWDLAAADYAAAFRLQEPTTPRHWACYLMLSRYVGDDAAHTQYARRLPQRFPPGLPYTKYDNELVRTCALAPVPDQDLDWLLKVADKTLAHELVSWNRTAKALALYRVGEFKQAIAIAEFLLYHDHEWSKLANCYLILALARNRMGKAEEARLALAAAERILEKGRAWQEKAAVGATPSYWFDWLEGEILHREAMQDIEARKPPDDPRAWYFRGRAFAVIGKTQEAADSYRRARELAKGRPTPLPDEVWPVRSIRIRGLRPTAAPPPKNPTTQSGS